MYLRRVYRADGMHYMLRESLRADDSWQYRDLMDLGPNPAAFIEYTDGNGFYFNPKLEENLDSRGVDYTAQDLEDVFLPFLSLRIRRILETSQHNHNGRRISRRCSQEELRHSEQGLHWFDVRRLYFLKFGHVDSVDFKRKTFRFCNVLLCKCRDEIEGIIEEMEGRLPAGEIGSYIYTALHLQSYFPHHILRNYPIGLDREKIDEYFMEEICRLNEDVTFFAGVERNGHKRLHQYLRKYVVLYFDHGFPASILSEEYIRDFQWRRQFRRGASYGKPALQMQEALEVFKLTREEFNQMSREDLARRYRRRAKKRHPDQGGDHDAFVRLKEAYELLSSRK